MNQRASNQVSIRSAAAGDRPALVGLMAELQEYERRMEADRAPGPEIAEGHFAYLEGVVERQRGAIFVAAAGAQPVGFAVCFVEAHEHGDLHVLAGQRRYGFISDLFVAAPYRAQGVGARLVAAAEAHLRAQGLTSVHISFLARNVNAEAAYRRLGYSPYMVTYAKRLKTYSKRLEEQ